MSDPSGGKAASFAPRLVLVPVDFSESTSRAWAYARRLAGAFRARVEALYVKPLRVGRAPAFSRPMGASERRRLKAALARTCPGASALNVAEGDVLLGIQRTAERRGAGLIVMATGGRTGLQRLLRPSLAEELVRSSPVPVLVGHGESPAAGAVLAPVNAEPYSIEGLRAAEKVAATLGTGLTALYVRERRHGRPLAYARLELETAKLRSQVPIRIQIDSGDPVRRILENGARHGLIVMTAHRKGALHDLALGSTAEQVLRRALVPVLTVPPSGAARPRRRRKAGRRGLRGAGSRDSRVRSRRFSRAD